MTNTKRTIRAPRGTELNCKNWQIEAAARLARVLTADPGMGVARHVDAGYERAVEVAKARAVKIPMMD